jgi:transcriptional regulator with XRE-family HTH domain
MPDAAKVQHIAMRVAEARQYLELTEDELADMVGVPVAEIGAIEAGNQPVSAALLLDIAKALGRGIEFFTAVIPVQAAAERTEFLARAAETLSEEDMGELKRFATYLRSRSAGAAN